MLSNYNGKCSNLHGHTYHGTVTIEGDVNSQTSMLLDYNRIKKIVDEFDHAIVFSAQNVRNGAEDKLYEWAVAYDMKYVTLPTGKSTAERIAEYLAISFLLPGVKSAHIKLSETDGSWAIAEATR
jgi:6-pyruvoyltetrahydropterin/6-carboxytetrahydropterin synthase